MLRKRIERKYRKIEFCKTETPEGQGGVIHMLYRGSFIPHSWLSEQWNDIHGAPNVFIQLRRGSGNRIANYFLGYLGHHSEFRLGYSINWVFKGFVREWTKIKRYYLRFFYFYGWSFRQAMSAAVFHLKQLLYWVATDPFYYNTYPDTYAVKWISNR